MHSDLYQDELSRMLTVNEVAHLLNIHPGTVRRWEKQRHLKSYRIGPRGSIRFRKEDVSVFINSVNRDNHRKQ